MPGRGGTTSAGRVAGLLLIAADAEPMDGPTGLWARTARDLAGQGLVVLRAERRDIGEAGDPASLDEPMPYTEEAVEDTLEAVRWLRAHADGPVAAAGLCSGAWMATKVCLTRPGTRLCAIGPLMWMLDPPRLDAEMLRARGWDLDTGRAPLNESAPDPRKTRLKTWLRTSMPYRLWHLASRTGRVGCPEDMLRALVDGCVPTTVVFPAGDRRVFELQRGSDSLRVIGERARALDFRDLDGDCDDHVLLGLQYRLQTAAILREIAGELTQR